jgi:hypothetical protein
VRTCAHVLDSRVSPGHSDTGRTPFSWLDGRNGARQSTLDIVAHASGQHPDDGARSNLPPSPRYARNRTMPAVRRRMRTFCRSVRNRAPKAGHRR